MAHFMLAGNICPLLAARENVNAFLDDGGIVP